MLTRRGMLLAAPAVALTLGEARAQQAWPNKPIRFISPGAPGGIADFYVRLMENRLRERLGQPVWIDNKPGAGSLVGLEAAANAAPDGYTFFMCSNTSHIAAPIVNRRPNMNPIRDVPGVARFDKYPGLIALRADHPASTFAELVAWIRAQPGRGFYSTAGNGTIPHVAATVLGRKINLELTHVPYRGTAPALTALLAGEVTFTIQGAGALLETVKSGQAKSIGVTSAERFALIPDVPTLMELGVPDMDFFQWFGVAAPAGVPVPILDRISTEIVAAVNDPFMSDRLRSAGSEPAPLGHVAFNAALREEAARLVPMITELGIVAD